MKWYGWSEARKKQNKKKKKWKRVEENFQRGWTSWLE
jgi:hypothetical protein